MKRAMKARPSPSMAVAMLALFISLGGSAVAVQTSKQKKVKVPANSVGAKQLKEGAVTESKLAPAAVTARAVRDNSLGSSKIEDNAIGTSELQNQTVNSIKLARFPGASAERISGLTVGGSAVQIDYDVEVFDYENNMYSGADPAKLVAPRDGIYQVTAGVMWQAEAGTRSLTLVVERADLSCTCEFDAVTTPAAASGTTSQTITSMIDLEAGDKVWVSADSTGDDGSTDIVNTRRPRLTMVWNAPGS